MFVNFFEREGQRTKGKREGEERDFRSSVSPSHCCPRATLEDVALLLMTPSEGHLWQLIISSQKERDLNMALHVLPQCDSTRFPTGHQVPWQKFVSVRLLSSTSCFSHIHKLPKSTTYSTRSPFLAFSLRHGDYFACSKRKLKTSMWEVALPRGWQGFPPISSEHCCLCAHTQALLLGCGASSFLPLTCSREDNPYLSTQGNSLIVTETGVQPMQSHCHSTILTPPVPCLLWTQLRKDCWGGSRV